MTATGVVDRVDRLINHLLYVIWAHEANAIVLYSNALSAQIPPSMAAHAFNRFREAMLCNEIVRLAACWIGDHDDDVSIPGVLSALKRPRIKAAVLDRLSKQDDRTHYANQIDRAIAKGLEIAEDARFRSFINHRNKYLAHNLIQTRLEKKSKQAVETMKMGEESWLLSETIAVMDILCTGTKATSVAWIVAREDTRNCAELLWGACKFQLT